MRNVVNLRSYNSFVLKRIVIIGENINMKTVIATDVSLFLCNGKYYYAPQVSTILKRYYAHFGKLTICGRVAQVNEISAAYEDVTDIIDEAVAITSLKKTIFGLYNKKIHQVVRGSGLVICRCPGIIAHRVADVARKQGKRYLTESMGCAWDAYWNHGIIGKTIAPYMFWKMKRAVYHADYAIYVTNEFLQKRYPCKNESVGISNVLIKSVDEAILQKRLEKIVRADYRNLTLMTTAAVDVRYKGQEFVINAIPLLNKGGIRVKYLLVGGGDATYLKRIARNCNVEDQVEFLGRRSLEEVFDLLDQSDIYIQPSLQEGLPRAMIEAMSRGCACIGAKTAGIPELITPECVVRRKSVKDIAETILQILNCETTTALAKRNFNEAKGYQNEILEKKRNEYFARIKQRLFMGD